MTVRAIAAFDVTAWDQTAYDEETPGPRLSRARVSKLYRGDLAGEGSADLLMCMVNPADPAAGAGYVASERVIGRLGGREGSFVLQHWGLSGGEGPRSTAGHVVPGSGTGRLAGLTGTMEISVDGKGGHTLLLDYEIR